MVPTWTNVFKGLAQCINPDRKAAAASAIIKEAAASVCHDGDPVAAAHQAANATAAARTVSTRIGPAKKEVDGCTSLYMETFVWIPNRSPQQPPLQSMGTAFGIVRHSTKQ
jgi:hypothetical protein